MKIIITAGGTTEKIDQVRTIANAATGKLGSLTAEAFLRQGGEKIEKIFYLCEKRALVPKADCVEVVSVQGVESAGKALSALLASQRIDAVVHSMAVSDYTVEGLTTAEDLSGFLAHRLFSLGQSAFRSESSLAELLSGLIPENDRLLDRNGKIGSDLKNLMVSMRQTPKLIGLIKRLQPSAVLVGFKLLNNVEERRLVDVAFELLRKNSCDFVLANDSAKIAGGRHVGLLISPDRSFVRLGTKREIAEEVARRVLERIEEKEGTP